MPDEEYITLEIQHILKEKYGIEINFKICITKDINDFIIGFNKQKYFINEDKWALYIQEFFADTFKK